MGKWSYRRILQESRQVRAANEKRRDRRTKKVRERFNSRIEANIARTNARRRFWFWVQVAFWPVCVGLTGMVLHYFLDGK